MREWTMDCCLFCRMVLLFVVMDTSQHLINSETIFLFLLFESKKVNLIEEAQDLATSVLADCLLVIHDTIGGGQHEKTEMARGQQVGHISIEVVQLKIEARADDTALVQATAQLNNDLSRALVIDNLELADVTLKERKIRNNHETSITLHTVLLHHLQESGDHLGCGAEQNLAATALLGIVDCVQAVIQDTDAHHSARQTRVA